MAEKTIRSKGPWITRQPIVEEYLPEWTPADASALKALSKGEASSDQQKRALDWIITFACGTYEECYKPGPGGERDTNYALGRQYAGRVIITLLHWDYAKRTGTVKHGG